MSASTMKAIVYTRYGSPDVLQLDEVQRPTPKANEVLVRVYATSVTAADTMVRRGDTVLSRFVLGLRRPRRSIIGTEIAGEVAAVGRDVTRFRPGDQVYGFTGFGLGAYAEYCCMPEHGSLVIKPASLSYEEAAGVVDGATTALFFLRDKAQIRPGHRVLIIGASGSIGTYAVQLASHFGAQVTGVCSTRNVELVRRLGADRVVDYTREDFAARGETYDIIFDTVGKSSFARCKGSLKPNGRYLVTNGPSMIVNYARTLWTSMVGGKRFIYGMSIEKTQALLFIGELIEAQKLTPVIDSCYPLEAMKDAHSYVEKGHKRGNVVVALR